MSQTYVKATAAFLILFSGSLSAQSVISAKSGLLHYTEGKVFVDDQPVVAKPSQFPELKERQVLRTEAGRAEVLLTPGVFLRVAEDSSLRMLSNKLWDVKIELLAGDISVEAGEVEKDQGLRVLVGESLVEIRRHGLYRISAETQKVKVFQGEALVSAHGQSLAVKDGRQTSLTAPLVAEKFDREDTDAFYRWAGRRAESISLANLSAARSARTSYNSTLSAGWLWNPVFGMFTYVPLSGSYYSPFGFYFFSPHSVTRFYERPRIVMAPPDFGGGGLTGGGGFGYPTVSRGSVSGHSGASVGGGAVMSGGGGAAVGGGRSADGGGSGREAGGSSRGR